MDGKRIRDNTLRMTALLMLGMWIPTLPMRAQATPKIVTGKSAAKLFVFSGKPLHPFCLDFTQEGSTRRTPIELADCANPKVPPRNEGDGWWYAEYPREEGDFFLSQPPGISYGVLASKGDRFLVGTSSSGGGSGQFTNLFWVRLDNKQVAVTKDEMGGDRCAGELGGYRPDGSTIRFSQTVSTVDILSLAGIKLDEKTTDNLRYGYQECDGSARYRYDLRTEKMELTSVSLAGVEPSTDDPNDLQACFDRLVQQYLKARKTDLKPAPLQEFGRKFTAACTTPNTRR